MSKIQVVIIGIVVFLLSTISTYSFFSNGGNAAGIISPISNYKPPTSTDTANGKVIDQLPKTEECPMNGEMLTKTQKDKWLKRRPLGIMIENHKEARPQSGLSQADIIYEAVAEGGITRFLSIFYCKDTSYVGPVRSARIYFLKLLEEYGNYPLYAHVGGANCDRSTGSGCANGAPADALGTIKKLGWEGYNDMNQFGVPFPYYWRDPERLPGVATEHTMYSSTGKLWEYAAKYRELTEVDKDKESWTGNFTKWKFADEATADKRGEVGKISLGFWNLFADDFSVVWNYDKTTNSYARVNGGQPHLDKVTGKQLTAKNVIVVFAQESPANDGYEGGHMLYKIIGSGDSLIFQNGQAVKGTWKKVDEETRMRFYDDKGREVNIVRGQVFVEILPIGNKVTY